MLPKWPNAEVEELNIPCLEMHVAHGCNLSCESCSHYSNQGHKGMLSIEESVRWIQPWSMRLSPQTFTMLGGEPTINPDLPEFFVVARRFWPNARLKLITNGFFLHRHPTLPAVLQRVKGACIHLSVHHDAPEYLEKLQPIVDLLNGWQRQYDINIAGIASYQNWTRRYHGSGDQMEPFNEEQQRKSWEICPARYTPQLFEGKIWKCAPLAYLRLQDAKYKLSENWKPYLAYQPLAPECSVSEMAEFFMREDESFCRMCPASPVRFKLPMPLNIKRK